MSFRPPHRTWLVPPGGNVPAGGNMPPGGNVPPGGNIPPTNNVPGGGQVALDNDAGTVLQVSTTIASLAAAVLALLPAFPALAKLDIIEIAGFLHIPFGFILMLCGAFAILSGIGAINQLRIEKNMPLRFRFFISSLGFLFLSLLLFFSIYIALTIKYL